jgi:6,7-dimethyl-8-ribityllumazine synthase
MQKRYDADLPRIEGARIAILQSKWYGEETGRMARIATELLEEAGGAVELHVLPGSLELPIAARTLAELRPGAYAAMIALGAVLKGDTLHFELVAEGCAQGLARVSLEHGIPILNEVLPCYTREQLIARTADDDHNKGIEAAQAAAEIISWRRSLE